MIFKLYIRIHIYISWVFYWFIYLASRQDVVTFRGLFVCLRLATSWFSDSLSWSTSPVKKSNSSLTERFKVRLNQGCLLRLDSLESGCASMYVTENVIFVEIEKILPPSYQQRCNFIFRQYSVMSYEDFNCPLKSKTTCSVHFSASRVFNLKKQPWIVQGVL